MRKSLTTAAVLSFALVTGTAQAAPYRTAPDSSTSSAHYSLLGGQTVAKGSDVVSAEVGWPGVSFGFTHGMSSTSDLGAKFDLLYGVESISSGGTQFGIGLRAPFRLMLGKKDKVSFLFHVDPGIKLYTYSSVWFGLQAPIGVTAAYDINPQLLVSFGVDLPLTLFVTPSPVALFIGPLFGPAIEFHPDRQLSIGLNTRFGPVFNTATPGFSFPGVSGSGSNFGFVTQAVLGYKL
jgi:hypothetical protein